MCVCVCVCVCVRARVCISHVTGCIYQLGDRLQMLPKKQEKSVKVIPPLLLKVMTDGSQHGPNGLERVTYLCVYLSRYPQQLECVSVLK